MSQDEFVLNTEILGRASEYARAKHGYYLSSDLLEALIRKIADKKTGMPFEEALRYSLNDLYLKNDPRKTDSPKQRILYRCAAAKYFSIISGLARKARAKVRRKVRRPKKSSVTGTVVSPVGKNRQYALKF